MDDTDELLAWLHQKHQEMPDPEAGSFYSNAADEIVQLRADYADMVDRADRAEADADRLAEAITASDGRERAYAIREALLAHDREVEAR